MGRRALIALVALFGSFANIAQAEMRLDGLQIGTGTALTIAILHGDMGTGGDPTSNYAFGAEIARRLPEARVHMLLRPGYKDPWGRQSPGENYGRRDQYTPANAALIAETLTALKGEAPLIAIGLSGGAAQLALALEAGGVDEAILIGCPCDLELWRSLNPDWPADTLVRSASAMDSVPNGAPRITLIVGAEDQVTPPALSESYAAHLQAQGVEAELIVVPESGHQAGRALSRAWLEAIFAARARLF